MGAPGDTAWRPVLVRPYGEKSDTQSMVWKRSVGVYQGSRSDPAR